LQGSITEAQREQRRQAKTSHGARSETAVYPLALRQKRSLLRRNGLRLSDLDGVGVALLDNWSRAHSKVLLLDDFFAREGLLDENGEPRGATKFYSFDSESSKSARRGSPTLGQFDSGAAP